MLNCKLIKYKFVNFILITGYWFKWPNITKNVKICPKKCLITINYSDSYAYERNINI